MRKLAGLLLLSHLIAMPVVASGEWYEDYESGKGNCDAGNYGTCIAKMQAAIAKKPNSQKSARTYGMNFVDYTPYYYLGLAHFNQGNLAKAVDAFSQEADSGVIFRTPNSGSFSLMSKQAAQARLAAGSAPTATAPAPVPPRAVDDDLSARVAALESAQSATTDRMRAVQTRLELCEMGLGDARGGIPDRTAAPRPPWLLVTVLAALCVMQSLALLWALRRPVRGSP